jgi:hypothetical protein
MCVVTLTSFLSGNLALCGAFPNLRADKWRIKSKENVFTSIES